MAAVAFSCEAYSAHDKRIARAAMQVTEQRSGYGGSRCRCWGDMNQRVNGDRWSGRIQELLY
eukprot:COSAG01_NODE_58364_length_306_cov_1.236715_1_plen_61_part_10